PNMGLFFKVEAASSRLELNSLQDAGSTLKSVPQRLGPGPPRGGAYNSNLQFSDNQNALLGM
ncbi:hypothetical protein, partial [Desulfonatronovibrio magnus]|uniref:hypothetical protein n=1 Tax=Desulfonatronovibrio magnus TaxID=698827 RepID=UPI0005EBDAB9